MKPRDLRIPSGAAALTALCACASLSAASRIEAGLVDLGVSRDRAHCVAEELTDHLDRRDLDAVADFLEDMTEAETPGSAIDALLRIDNPRAAAAIGSAGLSCALNR